MSQIKKLGAADYAPPGGLKFVDIFGLHDIYDALAFRANLLLVGPKGVGKTLSFQAWAAKAKSAIITFDCSEDVRRSHLIGMHILRGNETPFVLGPLTSAFEIANETGKCILVLEECNALSPQMQKVLNGVADFRRSVVVPECERSFSLLPGAKLWLVGTMNTSTYGGVYALNEDLKSRFRMLALDYPSLEQETKILADAMDGTLGPDTQRILQLAVETRQQGFEYALSPRDVQQVLEDVQSLGLKRALRILIGKFEGADRDLIKKRLEKIFAVKVNESSPLS